MKFVILVYYNVYVMKNLLLIIPVFALILLTGCTNVDDNILDGPWMINENNEIVVSHTYRAETLERIEMVWEDINVYDENDELVFSLVDNEDPQYLFAVEWKYLVVDLGTSADIREVKIYDIETNELVFHENYVSRDWSLALTEAWLDFYQKLDPNKADELPICENDNDNWYVSLYTFDFGTLTVKDTWVKKCTYFE